MAFVYKSSRTGRQPPMCAHRSGIGSFADGAFAKKHPVTATNKTTDVISVLDFDKDPSGLQGHPHPNCCKVLRCSKVESKLHSKKKQMSL